MSVVKKSRVLIQHAYRCSFAHGFEMQHPGLIPPNTLEQIGRLIDLYIGDVWRVNRWRKPRQDPYYLDWDQRVIPIEQASIEDVLYVLENMRKRGYVCAADVPVMLRDRSSLNRYFRSFYKDEYGPYVYRDDLSVGGLCDLFSSVVFKEEMNRPWLDACLFVPKTTLYRKFESLNRGRRHSKLYRIMYEMCCADLDEAYDACHLCGNGVSKDSEYVCVHAFHVVPGTAKINMRHKAVHRALREVPSRSVHALTLLLDSKYIKITPRHRELLTEIHRRAMERGGFQLTPMEPWLKRICDSPEAKKQRKPSIARTSEQLYADTRREAEAWMARQNKKGHNWRFRYPI